MEYRKIIEMKSFRNNTITEVYNNLIYWRSIDVLHIPCYCFFGLNSYMFKGQEVDESGGIYSPTLVVKRYFDDFSDNLTELVIENTSFDDQPVLLMITNPHDFFSKLRKYFIKLGFKENEIIINPIKYINKNSSHIIHDIFPNELFYKDQYFDYQNEIRIILNSVNTNLLDRLKNNNNIIEIGNLKNITSIEEFYFKDMYIIKRGNHLLYEKSKPEIIPIDKISRKELILQLYKMILNIEPEFTNDIELCIKTYKEALRKKHHISFDQARGSNEEAQHITYLLNKYYLN